MSSLLSSAAWVACLLAGAAPEETAGCLAYYSSPGGRGPLLQRLETYVPHEGDLVFFDDRSKSWKALYCVALTEPPNHSGIVVLRPDGRPALLESGPDDLTKVQILDVYPRLRHFKGSIWIRRCKRPLSREQSAQVTRFALAQEGKRYAILRMLLQGTPLRVRGSFRSLLFARTYLNRSSWLCSEIVVAAGTIAGLFDPKVHKANVIYPRDIIDDHEYELCPTWEPAGTWVTCPEDVSRCVPWAPKTPGAD